MLDIARTDGQRGASGGVQRRLPVADVSSRLTIAARGFGRGPPRQEPDEALMEVVLRRICREQFIHLSDDAARYLACRLPDVAAAR